MPKPQARACFFPRRFLYPSPHARASLGHATQPPSLLVRQSNGTISAERKGTRMAEAKNEATVVKCDTFDAFIQKVRSIKWLTGTIYRGHRDSTWTLASVWDRRLQRVVEAAKTLGVPPPRDMDKYFGPAGRTNRNNIRDMTLRSFLDSIKGLPGVNTDKMGIEDETKRNYTWAIGRHLGLATPLLDWSRSPLIAAFFACFDRLAICNPGFKEGLSPIGPGVQWCDKKNAATDSVAIWELGTPGTIFVDSEFEYLDCQGDNAYRQKAQSSLFTILIHAEHLDIESYLKSRDMAYYLTKFELPCSEVLEAIGTLELMNINYRTLFPDPEGAAVYANTVSMTSTCRLASGRRSELNAE